MPLKSPFASWRDLSPAQRRHIQLAAGGVTLSWALAALMACSSTPPRAPLYQQLGGVAKIDAVADRTLERVSTDPRTMRSFDGIKMPYLKKSVAAYLCKVADGPCVYEGETMANSHAKSNISGAEFDIMVSVMREELDRAGVPEGAKNELLRRLAPTRRDIVKY
ncbi:group 1 truncated hemoglobin [Aquabacterium sp. NJ1]|uniref:group I truncated hemoglobin n=1 Tax=Aquabacterium sp. NJ1 TaxID=1538295 RepID=UPI00068CE7C5|nr:group 1 truncated hemoglobin [Aquabacterium sp. NJ1]